MRIGFSMRTTVQFAVVSLLVCAISGCQLFLHDSASRGKSPLHPAQPSPDSVTMEIIWARYPADDPQLNSVVWQDVDETQVSPAVRCELANNGFRAGVISGTLPDAIARALDRGKSHQDASQLRSDEQTIDLAVEPVVHGRLQQLRRNQRSEIQASEVYPSLPLLVNEGRELGGRTYHEAQAIYALRVDPQPDRTAVIELTPELHYGPPKWRLTRGEDETGIFRQAQVRDHDVFHQLRMSVKLAPGELLVLMGLPDAGSRLGKYFHTTTSADGPQQKLILIRLADVPPGTAFANLQAD
jgi:hypothetical protein